MKVTLRFILSEFWMCFLGYNGRLKRKVKTPHPNPNKLLCFLKKELALSELYARHYENGGDPPYVAKKYRNLEKTRTNLKDRFKKGQISIQSFMKNIGGVCLKVCILKNIVNISHNWFWKSFLSKMYDLICLNVSTSYFVAHAK